MPLPTAPKIEFSARVRQIVEEIARQRNTEYRLVIRARLVLAMADGAGNRELARTQQLDRGVIRDWRARWIELTPKLSRAETSKASDQDLRDLVLNGLSDLPRSGAPPTFTAEQIVQIVAVACEEPSKSGLPISHWSPKELAAEVVKRQIVKSISPSSVGRFLKSGGLKATS